MKHVIHHGVILISMITVGFFVSQLARKNQAAPPPPKGWTTDVRILRIVDGDTVDVEVRKILRVRLLDCWAPESRTKDLAEKRRGLASKVYLTELANDEDAVLHVPGNEKLIKIFTFGRVIGDLWLAGDDETLSEKMIEAGHATKEKPPRAP